MSSGTRKSARQGYKRPTKPFEITDRQPPFNLEAEVCVLGSLMLMPDKVDEVVHIIRPTDFYDEAHGKLYEHMLEMHNSGHKIDLALLRERLIGSEDYEMVGGAAALAEIFTKVPNAAHALYYANIVRSKATTRELIETCSDVLANAYRPDQEPDALLNDAEQKVFMIRESRQSNTLSTVDVVLHEAMDRLEARRSGQVLEGTVETGFTDLDKLTGGMHASELIILAARPSMGKTALAMNICEHVVMRARKPALFVSLEMAAIELIERMLCSVARVNGHRLRAGTLPQTETQKLIRMAGELAEVPLFIDDSPTRTISEIAGAARRVARLKGDLGLIVIDYLQLIQPDNAADPRQEQVAKMARRLKGLARELKVPILCLSQLNRQADDAKHSRPKLSHLRESGAIEQDADVVMFVHRKDYGLSPEEQKEVRGQAMILVEKQRNGPTGDVDVTWLRDYTRFEDRAPDRHHEFDEQEVFGAEPG